MLRKLIKYDLLWMNRTLIIFYIITFVFAILMRLGENLTDSVIGSLLRHILPGFVIGAMINVIINAAIRIWVRFRQNCYKDEAYLTHTLPITRAQLYDSKVIAALISTVIAVAVVIMCFFVAFWNNDMYEYFCSLVENADMGFIIGGILITAFLEIIYVIAVGLFSLIVGHRRNNNRVLCSVIIGMVLYFALQAILLAVIYCIGFFDDGIKAMFESSPENAISLNNYRTLIISADTVYLVLNVCLYALGKHYFEKGINVD